MDHFEIDGKTIFYNINLEFTHCHYNKHGELIKAQRMILFFNESGNAIGSGAYYDDIDKITNISSQTASKVYRESILKIK